MAVVMVSGNVSAIAGTSNNCYLSFTGSGANTISAGSYQIVTSGTGYFSQIYPVTVTSTGAMTFQMKYKNDNVTGKSCTIAEASLTVMAP